MEAAIFPVILAGGASSRLWPVSDETRPKWDLRLFGKSSLLEGAWRRACAVASARQGLVVAGEAQRRRIRASLPELPEANLLIEPALRDTAGAVAYAAGWILKRNPGGVLLVLPGDHLIAPLERFACCARSAARLALQERALVTFGIEPSHPATSYGYVRRGEPLVLKAAPPGAAKTFRVRSFKEKPDRATAERYLRSGEYYWNGGIFAFPLPVLLAELDAHLPAHAALARALAKTANEADWAACAAQHYPDLKKTSIDFGIMERARNVATVAADFEWDDIGSWSAVRGHLPRCDGNAAGPGVRLEALEAEENIVLAPGRRVALIGVRGLGVIDDREGLLVCRLERDQLVKQVARRKPACKSFDLRAPAQGRALDVRIVEPPRLGPESGFLLVLHGYGNSRMQYAAAMERWAARYNMICVSPEYRDSGFDADPKTGKGARQPYDFSHLQLADCLNAYRAARLKYPGADGRRACVWGGSQGGHLAVLGAAFAPRTFALCVSACGAAYLKKAWYEKEPGRFNEAARAIRDARRWAGRVRCPVVLMHGTRDETVPWAHTRELARALLDAGKDVSVRFISGGDHFLRPAATRLEVTEQMADEALRSARRGGPDDFEAKSVYEFPCPDGVTYRLDFSSGIAAFERGEGQAGK